MKLAVFFPASLFSAWACSYGLVDCLRRMGHEVTSIGIDPAHAAHTTAAYANFPPCDGAIISGPEHVGQSIKNWTSRHTPAVAWLHETIEREDYGKLDVDAIKRSADVIFCPAIQDEKYGFRYLPFGVDTEIFNSGPQIMERYAPVGGRDSGSLMPKSIDAGFIGLLYPKRQAFLAELKKQGVNLVTGNVQVLELGGINPRKTAELYAESIRKIKVFVNLPTLSQLAVTKIYEVLACGTPILTPEVADRRNLNGLPVVIYKNVKDCAGLLQAKIFPETGSPAQLKLAPAMHEHHRLELRCEVLISALKELGAKSSHESLATA